MPAFLVSTVVSVIIRTKLNVISGVRLLWNTSINDFSRKGGGGGRGGVRKLDQ